MAACRVAFLGGEGPGGVQAADNHALSTMPVRQTAIRPKRGATVLDAGWPIWDSNRKSEFTKPGDGGRLVVAEVQQAVNSRGAEGFGAFLVEATDLE